MLRRGQHGVVYYQYDTFGNGRGLRHGVFTRLGGQSKPPFASLNVGHTVGDDNAVVDANQEAVFRALGVTAGQVITAHQVHGCRAAIVGRREGGQVIPETDALLTDDPETVLMLRFADCLPILFYDPRHGAVALAHAGWRGTMQNVAGATVRAMQTAYHTDPAELRVGFGPCIRVCCYGVGEEVRAAAQRAFPASVALFARQPDGSHHFDLLLANTWQLQQTGVGCFESAPFCTSCRVDEFYSHRRERGHTGRFAVLLGPGRMG